uniref:Anaphase-promoting complex subunit 4-like WD40 domain-containing protein n=1 Tax=Ananas comosus var. bracteatus TaxID=296719 RepID=A0A6V7PK83_ANACO|nr:unnamed protein product [Ananas comosus var. bracteatus]
MIAAMCWVPKGAFNTAIPVALEFSSEERTEEAEQITSEESEEDGDMDMDEDEVARASAAAKALGQGRCANGSSSARDIADALMELDMDHYDDEDEVLAEELQLPSMQILGIMPFGTGHGDLYYPSNDMDPYLKKTDDDDDDDDQEEVEDMIIRPTDSVILSTCSCEKYSKLVVWIYEESKDEDSNTYHHGSIDLKADPLCLAWSDYNLNGGDRAGNFIAVGSMEPAIEIWDLDDTEKVQPFIVLGGVADKKLEKAKKTRIKYKKDSHRDAILDLSWNKKERNLLASASADNCVKIWNVITGKCTDTLSHHDGKVQAVEWNLCSPEVLLSGSFDQSVVMVDIRSSEHSCIKWSVRAVVEKLAWDPYNEQSFVVSLENGMVQCFDRRAASSNQTSASKPTFTLHAHEKAVTSVHFNPSVPNILATGSLDRMVKLWDISNNQPSCVASWNPKAGAVLSISFSEDNPFLLAVGGKTGKPQVWDTSSDPRVVCNFGKHNNGKGADLLSVP